MQTVTAYYPPFLSDCLFFFIYFFFSNLFQFFCHWWCFFLYWCCYPHRLRDLASPDRGQGQGTGDPSLYAGFYFLILYLFCEILLGSCLVKHFIVCNTFVFTNSFNCTSLFLPWPRSLHCELLISEMTHGKQQSEWSEIYGIYMEYIRNMRNIYGIYT